LKKLAMLLLSATLAACQDARSLPVATETLPSTFRAAATKSLHAMPSLGSDCSGYDAGFDSTGGKLGLPVIDSSYSGNVAYATGNGGGGAVFYACPGTDNSFGMPVPRGHTPDWFGEVRFDFATIFSQADLYGKMSAPVWLPRTDYYMYLYDGQYHHVGSYKIGRANVKKSVLKFPSPFENGLATPTDKILYLEIAHRTK
jgi:hypothetical protein